MGYFLSLLALASISSPQASKTLLIDLKEARIQDYKKIQDVRDHLLAQDPYASLTPNSILADPVVRGMGLDGQGGTDQVQQALAYKFDHGTLSGYSPLNFDSSNPVLTCTIPRTDASGQPKFVSLKEGFKGVSLGVYKVLLTFTPSAPPAGQPPLPVRTQEVYVGILDKEDLQNTLNYQASHPGANRQFTLSTKLVEDSVIPVQLYINSTNQLVAVLAKPPSQPLIFPERPEFVVIKNTPAEVTASFKRKDQAGLHIGGVSWAVKTPQGIVDLEHYRREACLNLQKLRDEVSAKHPTQADFPPEMLQTPEFKGTGLDLQSQRDQVIFHEALVYQPEGAKLSGYHPIDFAKDPAANYTTATTTDGTNVAVLTLRDWFAGKRAFVYKIREESADPIAIRLPYLAALAGLVRPELGEYVKAQLQRQATSPKQVKEAYIGPMTPEALESIRKAITAVKLSEVKNESIPVNIYTNSEGDLAFVLAFEPKDLLLIPQDPMILVATDPLDSVKAIFDPAKGTKQPAQQNAAELIRKLHRVQVDYAIQVG